MSGSMSMSTDDVVNIKEECSCMFCECIWCCWFRFVDVVQFYALVSRQITFAANGQTYEIIIITTAAVAAAAAAATTKL